MTAMDLINILIDHYVCRPLGRLADRYPVLVGVPLWLLPVFLCAGAIYLVATLT